MDPKKTVSTVLGDVFIKDLGVTLPHEHLHMNFDVVFTPMPKSVLSWTDEISNRIEVFELRNLGITRQYPYSIPYNLKMDDEDTANVLLDELKRFKELGGNTIVENTIHGISRNAKLLKKLSIDSGVNIICGTGYYVAASQSSSSINLTSEDIFNLMLKELKVECEDGIQCGIIGEIGTSWPIHPFEKRVIESVAELQSVTGKPISFHPGRHWKSPFEVMRTFLEAGGKTDGVVMSHLDRTLVDDGKLLDFAELKVFNQFDLFGTECSYYQLNEEADMVSDAKRIQQIRLLIDEGYIQRILMSHDIHTKHRLVNFGGHGYGHILQNILPKMRKRGFTQTEINSLTSENPARWLSSL